MNRKEGYYHVKINDLWEIAFYCEGHAPNWLMIGNTDKYYDTSFDVIDETPITRTG